MLFGAMRPKHLGASEGIREAEVINRQVLWGRREKLRAGWKQRQEVEMLYSTGDEGAACHFIRYPCPHPQTSALQVARAIVSTMSSAGVPKRTEQPGCSHNQPGKWASRQRGTTALAQRT